MSFLKGCHLCLYVGASTRNKIKRSFSTLELDVRNTIISDSVLNRAIEVCLWTVRKEDVIRNRAETRK